DHVHGVWCRGATAGLGIDYGEDEGACVLNVLRLESDRQGLGIFVQYGRPGHVDSVRPGDAHDGSRDEADPRERDCDVATPCELRWRHPYDRRLGVADAVVARIVALPL